ncbi:MAG: hypothetical protein HYW06_06235 [Gemmatimonadetes bacterium]|nr:hypothetical protein [Gemmatimonadota bacterium]MBI2403042.1 hypothetical protein [Gemmatimonadota bacterium]MBI2536552.1 hypothetical protein [Gemmatimonadota bacterium]MBI2614476.1 hypothetical protein [Gemmatimonadota bacterium]
MRLSMIRFLALPIALLPSALQGQGTSTANVALRGVTALMVVADSLPEGAARAGLYASQLRTDVELRLREAGLTILAPSSAPGSPALYLQAALTGGESGLIAYSAHMTFGEAVRLVRVPTVLTFGTTWEGPRVLGYASTEQVAEQVRKAVNGQVSAFLNAWLAANPRD